MKEYTILGVLSIFIAVIVDKLLKTGILRKKLFWLFLLVILFFKFLVNGYLTGANIVMYEPNFFMGLRLGSIPLEDFLFGFSMVLLTLVFWEHFKDKGNEKV